MVSAANEQKEWTAGVVASEASSASPPTVASSPLPPCAAQEPSAAVLTIAALPELNRRLDALQEQATVRLLDKVRGTAQSCAGRWRLLPCSDDAGMLPHPAPPRMRTTLAVLTGTLKGACLAAAPPPRAGL